MIKNKKEFPVRGRNSFFVLARSDEVHKQNMQYMEKEEEMTTLSLAETIILTENIKKLY